MLEQNYQHYQKDLLKGMIPEDLGPKSFVAWGSSLLSSLRKAKSYLRGDPDNAHWLDIKKTSIDQLADMSKMVTRIINDPDLDPRDAQKVYDFVRKAAELLYEEKKLDTVQVEKPKVNVSTRLSDEHLKALERLQG